MNTTLVQEDYFSYAKTIIPQLRESISAKITIFTKEYCQDLGIAQEALHSMLERYLLGGKMHRAVQVLYWAKCYGCKHERDYISFAGAMEILQAFLLIHDDVMDDDNMRRNNKSIHLQLAEMLAQHNTNTESTNVPLRNKATNKESQNTETQNTIMQISARPHTISPQQKTLGASLAICLGDMLLAFAYELLLAHGPQRTIIQIASVFSKFVGKVGAGQFEDILFTGIPNMALPNTVAGAVLHRTNEQRILAMYAKKTGAYTFSLPMTLGMMLATENSTRPLFTNSISTSTMSGSQLQEEASKLSELGNTMGIMFQIRDDIIGACNKTEITGKVMGSDFIEAKPTYLISVLFRQAPHYGLYEAVKTTWQGNIGNKEIELLQNYIRECKVLEELENTLALYKQKAYNIVKALDIHAPYSKHIYKFIDYLSERDR